MIYLTDPAADVAVAEAWLAFTADAERLARLDDLVWEQAATQAGVSTGRVRRRGRLARFARSAARHPIATARTAIGAAKLLPAVRQAVPVYVWPLLALAALVKCLPLDMGADEALFALAFALIFWRRPGLLEALWREAQAGKPVRCQCARHARKAAAST